MVDGCANVSTFVLVFEVFLCVCVVGVPFFLFSNFFAHFFVKTLF